MCTVLTNFIYGVDFPSGSDGRESTCSAGDLGPIPGSGISPGEGNGYPFQYSGLENSMDCIAHGVAELDTTERLSLSEKEMATHSSILAWRIPRTEERGRL